MQRIAALAVALALSFVPVLGGAALAHGDKGVTVTPLSPKAGEMISVQGSGLGESRDIEIRLIGQGTDVDLGVLKAADDGDFADDVQLPADVKSGVYLIRAVGDDTVESQLTLAPTAAGTLTEATTAQSTSAGAMPPAVGEAAKQRPFGETAILVAIFGAIAALGLLFALTAQRASAIETA